MPYQNNNNRIVPNEVKDTSLKPVSNPTNQEIKYQLDLSQARKTAQTADALVKLGQGVLDMDYVVDRMAQENIITAEYETQAEGGNKADWRTVSKNVHGMAKFNPYNKEAFRDYQANDIYRAATIKLTSNKNVLEGKYSPEQYDKFKQDTIKEMMANFKEANLSPRNYEDYLNQFHSSVFKVDSHYFAKNAEYTYNNTLTAGAHNLALNAGANVFNAGDTSAKMVGLTTAVNEAIAQMQELGVPDDEIVTKVISVGMTEFLTNNADKMDAASFVAAMKGITIGDKSLNEIIPNYDFQMNQLYRQIKRQNYEDRYLEYQNQQLTNKMNMEDANRDFFQWYKNNLNATNAEIQQMALNLIGQYDLDSEALSFLNTVAGNQNAIINFKTTKTNPEVYNALAAKAATGELTNQEISDAILNGELNPDDAFKLQGKMEKVEAQENKEVQTTVKRILNDYTNKNGAYYKTTPPDVRNNINETVAQIQAKVDNGEMTPAQAQAKLKQLEKAIPQMLLENDIKNKNFKIILSAIYRNKQSVPEINKVKATKAIINMGLLRNKQGVRDTNLTIVSPQSPNRNGKPHSGNDIGGVYVGRPVYAPSNGEIIASGFESTMGNYAVFRDKRGKYLLLMHLKNTVSKGSVSRNTPIAYVGNTGRVEKVKGKPVACLHVEFWDENLRLTTPDKWWGK